MRLSFDGKSWELVVASASLVKTISNKPGKMIRLGLDAIMPFSRIEGISSVPSLNRCHFPGLSKMASTQTCFPFEKSCKTGRKSSPV